MPKMRGRLTVLTSMAIAVGILMIYTLGYLFPVSAQLWVIKYFVIVVTYFVSQSDWRFVSGISAIFCAFTMFLIFFIPESPTWLLTRGRHEEARKALAHIRAIKKDGATVDWSFLQLIVWIFNYFTDILTSASLNIEIEQMRDQVCTRNSSKKGDTLWNTLKKPEIYKPLTLINAFFAFQQFSGTFVIIVYATQFATEAGAGIDKFLCTVLIGLSRVLATIVLAYFILDKYGRKPPSIFSGIGKF